MHNRELLTLQVGGQTKKLFIAKGGYYGLALDKVHSWIEGINREHGLSLRVIPHDLADSALQDVTIYNHLSPRPAHSFPVDALIAYERPGIELGDRITHSYFDGFTVELATGRYRGAHGGLVVLGLTSADFKQHRQHTFLDIPDSRLILVPNFPNESGWYMPHAETGIPHGEQLFYGIGSHPGPAERYLARADSSSYIGILARNITIKDRCSRARCVYVALSLNSHVAVVVEVNDSDIPAIKEWALRDPVYGRTLNPASLPYEDVRRSLW